MFDKHHAGHGSKPTPGCLPSSLQERLPYESTIVASVSGSFQFHYECVRTTPHVAKRGTETRGDFRTNGDPTRGERDRGEGTDIHPRREAGEREAGEREGGREMPIYLRNPIN